MTEYTLFLDESYDDNTDLFCIAGCIIKNSDLNIVSNEIESIKQLIWTPTEISSLAPILHSTELNIAYKNRNNSKFQGLPTVHILYSTLKQKRKLQTAIKMFIKVFHC